MTTSGIFQIALDEAEILVAEQCGQVFYFAAGEVIDTGDKLAAGDERFGKIGADATGHACNEISHRQWQYSGYG